jgi:hypothetical protein
MHPDFPRWYAAVALGDDEARRALRWTGVAAVVDGADSHDIEALMRLAFKSRQPAATAPSQKIREAFRSADATFEMQGNDRELQILAGASLAALMHEGGSSGAEAALAVTTASLMGARKPDLPMDLAILAEGAIDQIAEILRRRPDLAKHTSTEAPKFDFEKSAAKVRAEWNAEGVAQGFTMAAEAARATFASMARRQANAVNALDTFLRVQDEELQMLWWLVGQRSVDLDCSFEEVPTAAQALVFAKELSDRTQFLPGPASMKGLLSRAGLKERKKFTVSDAINAADTAWLRKFMPEHEPSPVSTPLHYAIKRQLETGAGDAWIAGWAAAAGVPGNLALPSLTLGNLFFRERLLLLFGKE